MNSLEKNSFYSFLSLYIISSTIFILISAYWYYSAQESSLRSDDYYKLQHMADEISRDIISRHMRGEKNPPNLLNSSKLFMNALVDTNDKVVSGGLFADVDVKKEGYFVLGDKSVLISSAPQEHQNIKYVVIQSFRLDLGLKFLQRLVVGTTIVVIIAMIILAWLLSKLFMRPLRKRIKQVEDFIHDTAHELNTPITALSMSVSRAIKQDTTNNKFLKNISISTKQLFDIYNALSYLSFDSKDEEALELNICNVINKSVAYYEELAQAKGIAIESTCREFICKIDEVKLTMLLGNLINNAIKYSHPNSKIILEFNDGIFQIQDFGIGIDENKLTNIYDRFNRETDYAGGFGIGLSIVKKIADEHKLTLNVESKLGEGTTFFISFK